MTKLEWLLAIICVINNVRNANGRRRAQEIQAALMSVSTTTELSKMSPVIEFRSYNNITTELPKLLEKETEKWVGYSRQLMVDKQKNNGQYQISPALQKPQNNAATPLRRQTADSINYEDTEAHKFVKKPGVVGGSPFASDYFSSREIWDFARNLGGQGMPVYGGAGQGYNRPNPAWRQNFGPQTPGAPFPTQAPHAKFLDAGKEDGPQYGLLEGGSTKMAMMTALFQKAKSKLAELGAKINPLSVESQLNQLPKKDDFGKPVRWVKFNSDEIAYGIAQVTDPLTMKNQQFTIDGAIYVPVKSHPALKTGETDADYMAMLGAESSTSSVASTNDTMATVARNVKTQKMTMMDWLVTETLEVSDAPVEKSCIANKCPARCKNMNCDSVCNGVLCTSGCVGVSCNAFCSGTGCLSMCIGESCSSKCTGYNCSTRCWGSGCRSQCGHRFCFEYVNGAYTKKENEEPSKAGRPSTRGRPQEYGRPPATGYTGYGEAGGRNTYAYDYGMPGPPDYGRSNGPNDYGRPNAPADYGRPGEFGGYGRPAETSGYGRTGPVDYSNPAGPGNYERSQPDYGRQGNFGKPRQGNGKLDTSYYVKPWKQRTKGSGFFEEPKRPGYVRPGGPDGYLGPGYANVEGQARSFQRSSGFAGNAKPRASPNTDKPVLKDKDEEEIEKQLAAARKGPDYVDMYPLASED